MYNENLQAESPTYNPEKGALAVGRHGEIEDFVNKLGEFVDILEDNLSRHNSKIASILRDSKSAPSEGAPNDAIQTELGARLSVIYENLVNINTHLIDMTDRVEL